MPNSNDDALVSLIDEVKMAKLRYVAFPGKRAMLEADIRSRAAQWFATLCLEASYFAEEEGPEFEVRVELILFLKAFVERERYYELLPPGSLIGARVEQLREYQAAEYRRRLAALTEKFRRTQVIVVVAIVTAMLLFLFL